jgi:hypothetical protein
MNLKVVWSLEAIEREISKASPKFHDGGRAFRCVRVTLQASRQRKEAEKPAPLGQA